MGYQQHNPAMLQSSFGTTQHQSYNPINPMTGKYTASHLTPPPPIQNPLYKNPMMGGQRMPPAPPSNPQFYRNPYGGDDYRYQGGYQQ